MNTAGNWKNIFLLFIPGTMWGLSFLFIEVILETIPPFTLTMGRGIIAVIPLLLTLYIRGVRISLSKQDWQAYILLGLFNTALPFGLISWGQVYIDSGLATILISTMPFFTILLAHFFTEDEQLTGAKLLGIALGLVGVLVLIGPGALRGLGLNIWGQFAVIGGGFSYALSAIFSRRFLQKTRRLGRAKWTTLLELMTGQLICGTFFMLPLSLLIENPWTLHPSTSSLVALIVLGLFGTLVAALVYYYLIEGIGATFASTVIYLIPINGVFWGAYILNEPVTWQAILALFLILGGIGVINGLIGQKRQATSDETVLPTSAQ